MVSAAASPCMQSTSPIAVARDTYKTKGVKGFYAGCGALVIGNAVKAGVRFYSYDQFKTLLVNKDVRQLYQASGRY